MKSAQRIEDALLTATDTRFFRLGEGLLEYAPVVFSQFFAGAQPVVIADRNTWKVAGERVFNALESAGLKPEKFIIQDEHFHAEWKYVEMVDSALDGGGTAVSVGSGTINDLCKLASHHHGKSYLSIPTAASVDGFSSFGASITYKGAKQTFDCPAPVAVLADIRVLCDAPKEMTAAGYADLAAKVPAGAEWMIADFVGTEPIVPAAWHPLQDCLDDLLADPKAVADGSAEAVGGLFEGLVLSGFAMQTARSSRPASCCDHLFSHILDMTNHTYKGRGVSHGFQVAIGTLTMCAVFENLFKQDIEGIDVDACVAAWPTLEQEQQRALEIFKGFPVPELGYREITKKYEPASRVRDELLALKAQWPELKAKLQGQVYSFADMQERFRVVGAPCDPSQIGITRADVRDMFPKVQLMRYRFNVLDLAKRGGFYDKIVNPIFAKGGPWEINED